MFGDNNIRDTFFEKYGFKKLFSFCYSLNSTGEYIKTGSASFLAFFFHRSKGINEFRDGARKHISVQSYWVMN